MTRCWAGWMDEGGPGRARGLPLSLANRPRRRKRSVSAAPPQPRRGRLVRRTAAVRTSEPELRRGEGIDVHETFVERYVDQYAVSVRGVVRGHVRRPAGAGRARSA